MAELLSGLASLAAGGAVVLGSRGLVELYGRELARDLAAEGGPWRSALRAVAVARLRRLGARPPAPRYRGWIARALVRAGEPPGVDPELLVGVQLALAGLGLVLGGVVALGTGVAAALLLAPAGAALPVAWLRDRIAERTRGIVRALPYQLDLLTLSVEAGLDFTAAIARLVERGRPGPLRDELALLLRELRLGHTREEALRSLAARVSLPSVSSFTAALIQADRMGTGLGRALRSQAVQLRAERGARAEKLAGEAPVKLLFPLLGFIFPTVFLVLFGPIVFQLLFGGVT